MTIHLGNAAMRTLKIMLVERVASWRVRGGACAKPPLQGATRGKERGSNSG